MQLIPLIISNEGGALRTSTCFPSLDEYNLLQKNILRGAILAGVQKLITITSRDFFYKIKKELSFLNHSMSLILGPFQDNTAAMVAAAASHVTQFHGEETLLLVLAINHLNVDLNAFQDAIVVATEAALSGKLVTFGMFFHETNKKYIHPDESNNNFSTRQFVWNSNLFLFKAGAILQAMETHCPDVLLSTLSCLKHCELTEDDNCLILDLNSTPLFSIPKCSINEEVIKKSSKTVVLSCDLQWLDNSILN